LGVIVRSYAVKKKFLELVRIKDDKKIKVVPNRIEEKIFSSPEINKIYSNPFFLIFDGQVIKLKNIVRIRTIVAKN
jgi:hypothetical protein